MFVLQNLDSWTALRQEVGNESSVLEPKAVSFGNITIDFSAQKLTKNILSLLESLAASCYLREKIEALFLGEHVNFTEKKPALHPALRGKPEDEIIVNGKNIMDDILLTRRQIKAISDAIRNKCWHSSCPPIKNVINIGIGGSDLGPKFCFHALKSLQHPELNFYFISNGDEASFENVVRDLNPKETLFIVSSKSFTTEETLKNLKKAIHWIGKEDCNNHHFIAITANPAAAMKFNFQTNLRIWDWIGGRFSSCSAINLITAISIGYEAFEQLLNGAAAMDQHFLTSPTNQNLPIMLALIGVWNINFQNINNHLILPYSNELRKIVPFLQQLEMESNGKSIDFCGHFIEYNTAPIVWGGMGNEAQHSFLQCLYQGTHQVAADIFTVDIPDNHNLNYDCRNIMHYFHHGLDDEQKPYERIYQNTRFNHLTLANLSPETIGNVISLYEHKVFAQSVIWRINPFDQMSIERAKSRQKNF